MLAREAETALRVEEVEAALLRAADAARRIAAETGTPVVTVRDGQVVETFVSSNKAAASLREAG